MRFVEKCFCQNSMKKHLFQVLSKENLEDPFHILFRGYKLHRHGHKGNC